MDMENQKSMKQSCHDTTHPTDEAKKKHVIYHLVNVSAKKTWKFTYTHHFSQFPQENHNFQGKTTTFMGKSPIFHGKTHHFSLENLRKFLRPKAAPTAWDCAPPARWPTTASASSLMRAARGALGEGIPGIRWKGGDRSRFSWMFDVWWCFFNGMFDDVCFFLN